MAAAAASAAAAANGDAAANAANGDGVDAAPPPPADMYKMTAAADAPRPAGVKPLAFESADLVFVSYERLDLEVADAEGELKPQAFHALGLVGACSTTAITVKLYLPEESKVQRLPPAQAAARAVSLPWPT